MNEVATLVNDFFSGAKQSGSDIQELVETFAFPLGLVTKRVDNFVHESEENILKLPYVQEILELVKQSTGNSIFLKDVSLKLRTAPYGLTREAQYLILSALVAQRQIEFVTSKGDRINRRSLDLNIIWDDIVGIAKPTGAAYGSGRLRDWANMLSGIDGIQSIDNEADQKAIKSAFELWLKEWETKRVLERFDELPDEIFNTQIWKFSTNSKKTFGTVASAIREILADSISLEEGLLRIADGFSDSEKVFENCRKDFAVLEDFVNTVDKRGEIAIYLAVCGATENVELENIREKLLQVIDKICFNPDQILRGEMDSLWENFHSRFTEYFAMNHDAVMKSHLLQEQYDEIRRSDEWWEYENLASIEAFPDYHSSQISEISRKFKELNCRFNVKEMLKTHPFCACSFTLRQAFEWDILPQTLNAKLGSARVAYRNRLRIFKDTLSPLIHEFALNNSEEGFSEAANELIKALSDETDTNPFSTTQLIILKDVCRAIPREDSEFSDKNRESENGESRQIWREPEFASN